MGFAALKQRGSRYSEIWEKALSAINSTLKNPISFDAYFGQSELLRIEGEKAVISSRNEMTAGLVEEHYGDLILRVLQEHCKLSVNAVAFEVVEILETPVQRVLEETGSDTTPEVEVVNYHQFYPDYTFSDFVVCDSNRMAYHAALAVAEAPGVNNYNPLTIYGKTGLGKTHLMQAIGHFAKEEHTASKVYYISSYDFLQKVQEYMHTGKDLTSFYKTFEDVDILLIDDIQFLAIGNRTQDCFYTIFNKLINMKKQIVLTSDRLPHEIEKMHERLIAKFKTGLVVDIKPADLSARMEILRRKAKSDNLQLSDSVLKFLATKVTTNIRVLEGVLTKVLAHSIFTNKEVDIETVTDLLDDFNREQKSNITVESIQKIVAEHYGISANQLRAHTRKKNVSFPRSVALYLARTLTKQAYSSIGLQFGGRDHSTVIASCKKIEELRRAEDQQFEETILQLIALITS